MNNLFKKLIHDNDELIIALFHLNNSNYSISKLNHNSRIIIKKKPIFHLIYYMNFLEDLLKNLFDNNDEISYLIHEIYYPDLNKFIYEISLTPINNDLLKDFDFIYKIKFIISLTFIENKKIKFIMNINKNDINLDFNSNPFYHTIFILIINYLENDHITYLKNEIILKDVKPILNRHSFELDIT